MPTPATAEATTGATARADAQSSAVAGLVENNERRGANLGGDTYQFAPFPRLRHQAVDWLGIMHRRHTRHLLMEADVTTAREALDAYRDRSGVQLSLAAFVTACFAQAIGENKHMHAYRKGRNRLILFEDVDVAMLLDYEQPAEQQTLPPGTPRTPHVIRAANRKSPAQIEEEIRAAKSERTAITAWLPFWLLLPAPVRALAWMGLLNNPRLRKRITGTVAVSTMGMPDTSTGARWGIPLTAHTLALDLGGIVRKPGVVPAVVEDQGTHRKGDKGEQERMDIREYLCMTISIDDDVIDGAQVTRFAERLRELVEGGAGLTSPAPGQPDGLGRGQGQVPDAAHLRPDTPDRTAAAITAIKSIHTAIFLGMGSCVGYILYSGLTGRISRLTKLAMVTLTSEALIFSRNGFRCPLADMAEDLGSEHGTVGDIFLPRWFADRIPVISSVLLCIASIAYLLRRVIEPHRHSGTEQGLTL